MRDSVDLWRFIFYRATHTLIGSIICFYCQKYYSTQQKCKLLYIMPEIIPKSCVFITRPR